MHRRTLLAAFTAALIVPALPAAAATGFTDYKPGVIENALAEGKTVFVDYYTTWCSTCRTQARILDSLMQANPQYAQNILFVRVDWDAFGTHEVSTSRNIPRRSTLVMLKGDKELGRIVAGTGQDEIRKLLDMGL
jgi:thioredoxin 1